MPEGPFGLPRITDFGPFTEVDVDRTDIEFVEEEEKRRTRHMGVEWAGLPKRSNFVSIEAAYDSRGITDEDRRLLQDNLGIGDFVFERQAGSTGYYYHGDTAWSTKTSVKDEFKRAGLGSELMLQKLEGMRVRGVEEVWSQGATRAGRALLEKFGFRLADENDNIYTKVIR